MSENAAPHDTVGLTEPPAAGGPAARTGKQAMRKVALASGVGTFIEYYDFLIYAYAAALVFSPVFYPELGASAASIASFATLGVGLVARPFGSLLFGHFGDRLGRKKIMIAVIFLMGISTTLVGLMPTTAQIGILAPILLLLLRVLQGIAVGGEWAGAVMFAAEHAPPARRGFWTMMPLFGAALAMAAAPGVLSITSASMSSDAFLSYGWRIPFLISIVLVGVGLYIRLQTEETPVFKQEVATKGAVKLPFAEAWRNQPRDILLAIGAVITVSVMAYMGSGYLPSYATSVLKLDRTFILVSGIVAGVVYAAGVFTAGLVVDRVGRKKTMITVNIIGVGWALLMFPVLDIGTPAAFMIGLSITLFIGGAALGPMGTMLSEVFATRYRYTAAGFSFNFAQIIGGAIPPIVAAPIIASAGTLVFSLYIGALCLVSVLCIARLRENRGRDLAEIAAQ
jgi:MFS family permease